MNNVTSWTGVPTVKWTPVLNKSSLTFGSHYKIIPTEGYLAWEYNPLRNYRLSECMYEKDGKYYTKEDLGVKYEDELQYESDFKEYREALARIPKDQNAIDSAKAKVEAFESKFTGYTLHESGELVDFITNELSFNLSHPVDILPQYSYDGSVNLIINDGLNIPRLINSRFTVTGRNTYKIIDRKGDNDTNIYDQGDQFDTDTSLFKNVNKIPKLEYLGTSNGNMPIGNYHFYFKYSDSDGNESDWVAESGLVSVFIGNSPGSMNTGIRDENSIKSVRFRLSNIDLGYVYVKVYYTRYSADVDSNIIVEAKQVNKNFLVNNSGVCNILLTGDEDTTTVTLEEINSSFDVIQNAQTQCTAANRLFMANIHKSKIEYDILSKLSLCFCPYKKEEDYPLSDDGIDQDYNIRANSDGYYDTKYIYDKTGYWPGELYRFGIVYILKDGSLSPVFNIRGATNIPTKKDSNDNINSIYKVETDFDSMGLEDVLHEIDYSEEDFMIIGGTADNENAKGVVQFSQDFYTTDKAFPVVGVEICANHEVLEKLKDYTKGFFFVRQKRIPLTLAQGVVVGLDNYSNTPTLPTLKGVVENIDTENSYVETSDINDINFISEGFLGRYYFDVEPSKQGIVKRWLKALGVIAVIIAAVVATVFTCGVGGAVIATGVTLAAAITTAVAAGAAAIASAGVGIAVATAALVVAASAVAAGEAIALKVRQNRNKGKAEELKGRRQEIPEGYERKEKEDSRLLTEDVQLRYIVKDSYGNNPSALIVPDYQVNTSYYNQFLTGGDFTVKLTYEQSITNYLTDGYFESKYRHFYVPGYTTQNDNRQYAVKLVGVPDGCPSKLIGGEVFKARAGYPEEAYKYEFVGQEFDDSVNKRDNSDIIRGNFGSYVGMSGYRGHACDQLSIMIPGYQENDLFNYIQIRANDNSAFYAISDRIDIKQINNKQSLLQQGYSEPQDYRLDCFRGDCYICQYSHRIIRNFNDPSAPYNDKIVDPKSWKDNYDPDKPENYANINLGDVNAVPLGLWLTFQLRSSYNLNIRTVDKSHVDEYLMSGNYRSFYPNYGQAALGSCKLPDSDQYNKGFTKSVSEKYYFEVPDVPYIKQEFQNRIVFSDIHINDAYKNGFRVLRTTNHKDYPMTHGSITKLIEVQNQLLVVFEHGVGLISINNSAEYPSQILSDVKMISDMYGSQWKDSIIKTPEGVYGVDTVAKKIWVIKNSTMQLISDFKVQEFLNQNITLSERELTPILGIRNVKTFYNAFKHDVMFTFYDNLYGVHEKAWNLCWNELLGIFTTFYSWIPSDMENIDNIPFSFNRDVVKSIGKLGASNHYSDYADGVTLSNNVLNITGYNPIKDPIKETWSQTLNFNVSEKSLDMFYYNKQGTLEKYKFLSEADISADPYFNDKKDIISIDAVTSNPNFIGFLHLDNRTLPGGKSKYIIEYELMRDNQRNDKLFNIQNIKLAIHPADELLEDNVKFVHASYLELKNTVNVSELMSEIYKRNIAGNAYADTTTNAIEPVTDINGNHCIFIESPIFKNKAGKRIVLSKDKQINPDKIVRYLNIRANIFVEAVGSTDDSVKAYYKQFANGDSDVCMIDSGYFESQVAISNTYNVSMLFTDFWKHGQAGIIDIADKIFPTYWYGQQHPFEFECIVVDDPSVHKIFTNLELVANKTKPESFHYEVVGDVYDFADDKPTMYFRQEALKALYQYNGYDIEYNPNFLEIQPIQHNRSADLPKYYSRQDTINDIYDSYKRYNAPGGFDYDHLSGAEIVYYPTRNEFRVWNHVEAIDVDSKYLNKKGMLVETSVIKANCRYLEDKWLVSINPIIVTYKNEFNTALSNSMFKRDALGVYCYSTWVDADQAGPFSENKLPPINFKGTRMEHDLLGGIQYPGDKSNTDEGKDNALYQLYDLGKWNQGDWRPIDPTGYTDRRETDVRGKFMKVRIRYSGEELAIIDFLNTIYQISYA